MKKTEPKFYIIYHKRKKIRGVYADKVSEIWDNQEETIMSFLFTLKGRVVSYISKEEGYSFIEKL